VVKKYICELKAKLSAVGYSLLAVVPLKVQIFIAKTAEVNLRFHKAIFLLPVLGLLSSCFDQGDCLITNSNLVQISLKDFTTKASAQILFDSVYVPGDTLVYTAATTSSLVLPVDQSKTETMYVLKQATRRDTIVFTYSNQTLILSPDCGAFVYQRDLWYGRSTLPAEQIRIVNGQLARSVTSNVELYF
jgi:hypothetical protein